MRATPVDKATYYQGVRMVPYDLVKELALALAGTLVVILVLSAVLSSPDVPSVTIQSWARADPVDFVTTGAAELSGSSTAGAYGPPYNSASGSTQTWGFFQPENWAGVHQPVDAANDLVLTPLQLASGNDADLKDALATYRAATSDQQHAWTDTYTKALDGATAADGAVSMQAGDYGPVQAMMNTLLRLGQTGALDGLLLASAHFYQTDYTAPLLFMSDGGYLEGLADGQHLTGDQWGVMNETGRYPGQAWLWLYSMWYQVAPFNRDAGQGFFGVDGDNADLAILVVMAILTLLLVFVPFIPGLRDIPRWIPIHRLIWRRR
jgi:hypothetical protein